MHVREADRSDASSVGGLVGLPDEAATTLLRNRTVRVAEREAETAGAADPESADADEADADEADADGADADGADVESEIVGVVAFDARPGVVDVTQLRGEADALSRLLEEPVRFAVREGMDVEIVVPESATELRSVVDGFGVEADGEGPRFEGETTRRYRLSPDGTSLS